MLLRYVRYLIVSVFAYVQAFNLCCQELVKIKHEQYANLQISKSLIIKKLHRACCLGDLHVLPFFKSRNCLISTDVREDLCTLSHVTIHINLTCYNDNLIYGHNQDYCRKSYFNRNAELWNLIPSSIKTIHHFSSFKTSLNNIYLSKRETYKPPGY